MSCFLSSIVYAEDQMPVIAPVKKSEAAPFDGVVLSPEAVAATISTQELLKKQSELSVSFVEQKCVLEKDHAVKEVTIKNEADTKILKAQLESSKKDQDQLAAALKEEINSRPNLLLWTGGSVIVGVAATVIIVMLIQK